MAAIVAFLREHRGPVTTALLMLLLSTIPAAAMVVGIGSSWRGIVPTFTDELNFARVHTIAAGNWTDGNPYFLEHAKGPPLVIFGGAWLNALVITLPLPLIATLYINFILWSLLFGVTAYYLARALGIPRKALVVVVAVLYLGALARVWRPANMQPVYPFYFLFLTALMQFLRDATIRRSVYLGLATGATFYLYTFLWQMAVATLVVSIIVALLYKQRELLRGSIRALVIGVCVGLPIPLYLFYLSHTSPYFWESLGRLGLVTTHIPTSEVLYSGGWVIVVASACWLLFRAANRPIPLTPVLLFSLTAGGGLLAAQSSNVVTGSWFETGEHVRVLIIPWLTVTTAALVTAVFQFWGGLRGVVRFSLTVLCTLCIVAVIYFSSAGVAPFLHPRIDGASWRADQAYAGPLTWLRTNAPAGSVVWSDPHTPLSSVLVYYTNAYVLYAYWGGFELLSDAEWYERYLVARYFDPPTAAELASPATMWQYLGRKDLFHHAKTIEREITICRLIFFWRNEVCAPVPTAQSLLGDAFFEGLATRFATEIAPNIMAYLERYRVGYVIKDLEVNSSWHPEKLKAKRVYADERYEIYQFPWAE